MGINKEKTINIAKILADTYSFSGDTLEGDGYLKVKMDGQTDDIVISSYDSLLDLLKVQEQSPLWNRYTDVENLVTASDIGLSASTYKDQGAEIDCRGYNKVAIFVNFTVNDSTGNTIKVLSKHTLNDTNEYVLETSSDYIKTLGDASIKIAYVFDCEAIPFIQIQSAATSLGDTEGTLTIDVIKKY